MQPASLFPGANLPNSCSHGIRAWSLELTQTAGQVHYVAVLLWESLCCEGAQKVTCHKCSSYIAGSHQLWGVCASQGVVWSGGNLSR